MSWPVSARASAAAVIWFLKPIEVMKSSVTSTLLAAPQSWHILASTSLAPGTQWSHMPSVSVPAECAVLT
jgi:hypothetical protein